MLDTARLTLLPCNGFFVVEIAYGMERGPTP